MPWGVKITAAIFVQRQRVWNLSGKQQDRHEVWEAKNNIERHSAVVFEQNVTFPTKTIQYFWQYLFINLLSAREEATTCSIIGIWYWQSLLCSCSSCFHFLGQSNTSERRAFFRGGSFDSDPWILAKVLGERLSLGMSGSLSSSSELESSRFLWNETCYGISDTHETNQFIHLLSKHCWRFQTCRWPTRPAKPIWSRSGIGGPFRPGKPLWPRSGLVAPGDMSAVSGSWSTTLVSSSTSSSWWSGIVSLSTSISPPDSTSESKLSSRSISITSSPARRHNDREKNYGRLLESLWLFECLNSYQLTIFPEKLPNNGDWQIQHNEWTWVRQLSLTLRLRKVFAIRRHDFQNNFKFFSRNLSLSRVLVTWCCGSVCDDFSNQTHFMLLLWLCVAMHSHQRLCNTRVVLSTLVICTSEVDRQ